MNKPEKQTFEPVYNYRDIIDYIESKYGIQTRGYKREIDGKYRDFWHYCVRYGGVHNGSFMYLPGWDSDSYIDEDGEEAWWVREIMDLIKKEFFPGDYEEMRVWVDW